MTANLKTYYTPARLTARGGFLMLPLNKQNKMLLSAPAIRRHMKVGTITIDPFKPENLGNASYDVTLGEHFFREHAPASHEDAVFNLYDEAATYRVWGKKNETAQPFDSAQGKPLNMPGIKPTDKLIWLAPNETILAHTQEFIGGTQVVDTMLKARSSTARNFISVCKCAGWGDVGYVNRWTMQITNHSRFYRIPLVVGRRIAQIIFFEVEPLEEKENAGSYASKKDSKYQTTADLKKLKALWKPADMLPKMWKDRDALGK